MKSLCVCGEQWFFFSRLTTKITSSNTLIVKEKWNCVLEKKKGIGRKRTKGARMRKGAVKKGNLKKCVCERLLLEHGSAQRVVIYCYLFLKTQMLLLDSNLQHDQTRESPAPQRRNFNEEMKKKLIRY